MHRLQVSSSPFLVWLSNSYSFPFHLRTFGPKITVFINILVIAKWSGSVSERCVYQGLLVITFKKILSTFRCFYCSLIGEIKMFNGLLIYRQLAPLFLGNKDYIF